MTEQQLKAAGGWMDSEDAPRFTLAEPERWCYWPPIVEDLERRAEILKQACTWYGITPTLDPDSQQPTITAQLSSQVAATQSRRSDQAKHHGA